ncbi:MAG: magnesium chelatase [Spirochaetales bacterium]|nr:magnesium chelatase [Spirochaetales bacterium]
MMIELPRTLRELKESKYRYRPVKTEMASNLARRIQQKEKIFPEIHGYDDTVIPQLMHAILAGHNLVILGEKGQAKSRLMRALTSLLDPHFPVIDGTDIPESPFQPVTAKGKKILGLHGDETHLRWLTAEERYGERLAPGSRIADIIGDIDPARVMEGGSLGSEDVLFYGLLPRMNHGIFAINELPDLDYLVQVALFNILEESDIQIRGLPLRLPLDVFVCFTANPADYSRSGKIITQLKDRMGSEIRTHYPRNRTTGIAITRQEASLPPVEPPVNVPEFIEQVIEEITAQARISHLVNQKSGVSARLSIANYETAIASARRRALEQGHSTGVVRMSDLGNLFASSSGKIELDPYRDEAITEYQVINKIIDLAIKEVFLEYYPLKKYEDQFDEIARQVFVAGQLEISDHMPDAHYSILLKQVPALFDLLSDRGWKEARELPSGIEFILEGLTVNQKLSRRRLGEIASFKSVDVY